MPSDVETTTPATPGPATSVPSSPATPASREPSPVPTLQDVMKLDRWIHQLFGEQSESRLRLYLVDLPEGMSVETLAITVVAPEERFEELIEETAPIIDSIEFNAP